MRSDGGSSTALRAARSAGLRHVADSAPGILRLGPPGHFRYRRASGTPVRDRATLSRIARIVIPPAWTHVWICPLPAGHIQAVGRDARGRKQYRYHERWREVRDADKYAHLPAFARVLPRIRRRVAADLNLPGLPRAKLLAAVVRLLESTRMRIGNDEYARQNGSYGLTTIRNGHARVRGSEVAFSFRGKSGKEHRVRVEDPKLARIVRRCQELPGQRLFEYLDEAGRARSVASHDVNAYLAAASGRECTAKDFRTWTGTVLAARELEREGPPRSGTEAEKRIVAAVKAVASQLGNTPAVCRRSYIDPEILAAYRDGRLHAAYAAHAREPGLRRDEETVLALLRRPESRRHPLARQLRASLAARRPPRS